MTAIASHTPEAQGAASERAAVSVRSLDKTFRLPHQRYSTLKERALHPLASNRYEALHALRDLTFDVAPGEFFGIVGRNGSGKSTLLKCLAGIYSVDSGSVDVRGRLSPFIELGVGFNNEMTARDNVMINAIMLGLSRRQARARFDKIIEFAELEDFVDMKLKNYSSGMSVRLGFAVAIQVDADVLLVDEVLAVGDAAFQQKCFDEFNRLKAEGRTVLFVTHDMASVREFCDRATLIDKGRMMQIGDPEAVATAYAEINFGHTAFGARVEEETSVKVTSAWCEDAQGERISELGQGERCVACVELQALVAVDDPQIAVTFRNDVRHTIFVASTPAAGASIGSLAAGATAVVRFGFDNWLAPSRYTLTPSVAAAGGQPVLDVREDLAALTVTSELRSGGVADIPHDVTLDLE